MSVLTTDSRKLSTIVGCCILAAATNATILKSGGYLSSQALLAASLSIGVYAGARSFGAAWKQSTVLAMVILAALAAGEIYNFAGTAERTVAMREDMAAPLKAAAQKRQEALDHLKRLQEGEVSSARLRVAQASLDRAQKAVDDESANGGCRRECQRKQVVADEAKAEVQAAAREAEAQRPASIAAAQAEVDANPLPASATPFADRIGCPPWIVDLAFAGLLSLGSNLLAGALIAYGAHETGTETQARVPRFRSEPEPSPKSPSRARSEAQKRANDIAAELRNRNGEPPKFHVVRSEYRNRYGTELPKVTAHRAVG